MPDGADERFVARPSRGRLVLLLAGALLFVAGGLWMAGVFGEPPDRNRVWLGWACALFFGLCGLLGVARLRDTSDQIVIDGHGVTYRLWSDDHIPWAVIERISERRIQRQVMFSVYLADPADFPPTRLLARMGSAQRGMGLGDFALVATGTDKSADDLRDALDRFIPGGLG